MDAELNELIASCQRDLIEFEDDHDKLRKLLNEIIPYMEELLRLKTDEQVVNEEQPQTTPQQIPIPPKVITQ
jgi:hypothetical protein